MLIFIYKRKFIGENSSLVFKGTLQRASTMVSTLTGSFLLVQTVKNLAAEQETRVQSPGSIFGLERPPGEGNDYPPQYSCLENSMDRGATGYIHGVWKNQTTDWLTCSLHLTVTQKSLFIIKKQSFSLEFLVFWTKLILKFIVLI